MKQNLSYLIYLIAAVSVLSCQNPQKSGQDQRIVSDDAISKVQTVLSEMSGGQDRERISKGVKQLAGNWFAEDGTEEDFIKFCTDNFLLDDELKTNFDRICKNRESLEGYSSRIRFSLTESDRFTDVEELKADQFFRRSIPSMDPYQGKLNSHYRKFIKDSDHSVIIEDHIEINDSTRNITWGMMTVAEVEMTEKGAILMQDGKRLNLKILSPDNLRISVISMDPPPLEIDKTIKNLKRIEIRVPAWIVKNHQCIIKVRLFE